MKNATVLVADDSRLICTSLANQLRAAGFNKDNIALSYKSNDVLSKCRQTHYDLIICDYNFNGYLNGYQLLEELRHHQYLQPKTLFIFLTGENDQKVVRTIIDTQPDDYILKPFNKPFLLKRIKSGMQRKRQLLPLYQALERRDYQMAIDECDRLIESFPQYTAIILKIKAESLNHSQQYSAAKQLYLTLLKENNQDWVKVALANTLVKNNEVDQAKGLLNTLKNKKNNPYYFDEMSNISLVDDDVPAAISHLKRSTMLLEAGADRELIIANLSMAVSAYKDAFLFIERYYDSNKNTYRGNIDTRINYLRYFLFQFFDKHNQSTFEHQLISMMPILKELNQRKDLNLQNALVSAHIHLLRGEINQAITRLASVFPRLDTLGFYDLYHLLALLERCSMLKEIKIVNQRCRDKIKAERNLSLYRTQVYMLSNFESALERKQQTVTNIKYHIEQLKQFGSTRLNNILDCYLQLHDIMPYSQKLCLAIIKLIAFNIIAYRGKYDLRLKLSECHQTLSRLLCADEQTTLNYQQMYQQAQRNLG